MLIPKEQPYLLRLNSYYLHFQKFIEHLQGEIGSGCLYCQSLDQEILIYFDEHEIIRSVIQQSGKKAQNSPDLESVIQILSSKNFLITVYFLNPDSIFYWSELSSFQRNKSKVDHTKTTLPDLVTRFKVAKLSGFVDIDMGEQGDGAILFFHQGVRRGGSYSWGEGGLNPSEEEYDRLLRSVECAESVLYNVGRFVKETEVLSRDTQESLTDDMDDSLYLSDLETAVKEFLTIYMRIVKKKLKTDPVIHLKHKFLDNIEEYPQLDLFKNFFQLSSDGTIEFSGANNRKGVTDGIVACTWKVIEENGLENKFRVAIKKWDYKLALEERGVVVLP